jgi:hypothetical protein
MIDFALSEQQSAIRGRAQSFAENVLSSASTSYENYPNQRERFQALQSFYRLAVGGEMI